MCWNTTRKRVFEERRLRTRVAFCSAADSLSRSSVASSCLAPKKKDLALKPLANENQQDECKVPAASEMSVACYVDQCPESAISQLNDDDESHEASEESSSLELGSRSSGRGDLGASRGSRSGGANRGSSDGGEAGGSASRGGGSRRLGSGGSRGAVGARLNGNHVTRCCGS